MEGLGVIYAAMPQGYNEGGWKERTVNAIGTRVLAPCMHDIPLARLVVHKGLAASLADRLSVCIVFARRDLIGKVGT